MAPTGVVVAVLRYTANLFAREKRAAGGSQVHMYARRCSDMQEAPAGDAAGRPADIPANQADAQADETAAAPAAAGAAGMDVDAPDEVAHPQRRPLVGRRSDASARAVTRARCICACGRLPWQPGEWYGSYGALMKKNHLSHNPLSASCSGNWNDGWRPVQGALFVALVTVCRCRRRAAGGENPLARWAAMPIRRALAGHYFLQE